MPPPADGTARNRPGQPLFGQRRNSSLGCRGGAAEDGALAQSPAEPLLARQAAARCRQKARTWACAVAASARRAPVARADA